ncbi:flagellar basal body protein [Roseateles sp. DAIF2]|uniref:flagellar basal body protein n=1 Tax=Roseateles sp. DAIF2 TaxID=2714952 RepID=UPI0018A2F0EA|nr:flagellar basal body protein [Roseateles sp. DAIF2]QPF74162.1 flagellar basal body protein [Roseateles sp. DAIF2]
MTKNFKLILVGGLVALLAAGAAGGAVWWKLGSGQAATAGGDAPKPAAKPAPDYKYVTLDKVLVMLRGRSGESVSHYMAVDVVFKALPEQEKRAKEHLPLLRTVAVKALSAYTVEAAQAMTVVQFAEVLNKAYKANYAAEQREPPFAEALIGKLIIE